jgi:hypothetical protein
MPCCLGLGVVLRLLCLAALALLLGLLLRAEALPSEQLVEHDSNDTCFEPIQNP